MVASQGIFEETAIRKLIRRNIEAIIVTVNPSTTFVPKDLIKISVYPTSANHHQSVINETRLEKKIIQRKTTPMIIHVKNLAIFIHKKTDHFYRVRLDSILAGCN